ncbi:hypothetical protein I6F36_24110 [Bradyrhizobium sp. BRP19]|nr:hypothetical protein [Bradyrhizobium sp. BRP19]MCA1549920.1 hypothetical protein [Bradyrhizobium sp. BRP19]
MMIDEHETLLLCRLATGNPAAADQRTTLAAIALTERRGQSEKGIDT